LFNIKALFYKELKAIDRKRSLEEKLSKENLELLSRFKELADIIENAKGDVTLADAAEMCVREELQALGNEVLHGWARRQSQNAANNFKTKPGKIRKGGKKN
jgi:hypothetical protein